MNRFSLDNLFAALRGMRAGSMNFWWNSWGSAKSCGAQQGMQPQQRYDSVDESPKFQENCGCQPQPQPTVQDDCGCQTQPQPQPQPTVKDDCGCQPQPQPTQSTVADDCPGFTCRHNPPKPTTPTCPTQPTTPTCPPEPTPTCTCSPEPTPTCQPQPTPVCPPPAPAPSVVDVDTNINTGIIDGPGNDIYDGPGDDVYAVGNSGIIDTQGNDIYAQNYSINTYNTVNNFWGPQPTVEPTPTPTVEPTPTIEPTPTPTIEPTPTPTIDPPSPTAAPAAINLTPLRNLLTGIEKLTPDGVLSDAELAKAMANPHYADLDGNPDAISSQEMAIFNKIKEFNQNKDLISAVLKGDYSNIDEATLESLGELSDEIKNLTLNR